MSPGGCGNKKIRSSDSPNKLLRRYIGTLPTKKIFNVENIYVQFNITNICIMSIIMSFIIITVIMSVTYVFIVTK